MCIIKLRTWRWGESLFWIISGGPMLSQWFLKLEEEGRRVSTKCDYGRKTHTTFLALMMEGGGNEPKNVGGLWEMEKSRK